MLSQLATIAAENSKFKGSDTVKALELLGKHLKLFTERYLVENGEALVEVMREGRQRAAAALRDRE